MSTSKDSEYIVGVDVGGTKLNTVLLDSESLQIVKSSMSAVSDKLDSLYQTIIDSIELIASKVQIRSIGIGLPGMVDDRDTMCFSPHIASLNGHNLAKELKDYFNCPLKVENDANCALIAESVTGVAKGKNNVLMVTLGTGIGGSIITDGNFLKGHRGFIGEIGHMAVTKNGNPCVCGKFGCWETYAASSTLPLYYEFFKNHERTSNPEILRTAELDFEKSIKQELGTALTGQAVMELYIQNEEAAVGSVESMMDWVGFGLSSVNSILAPELIVLGGGIVTDFRYYEHTLRESFKKYAQNNDFLPLIVPAANGANAGAVGAAIVSLRSTSISYANG